MLQAGFARVDVTPPMGSPVDGYFKDRVANGVLDPIQLNALAISDGEHRAVMIAGDFLGVEIFHVAAIKELITHRTGFKNEEIFLSATHSHTSVFVREKPAENLPQEYINLLYRKYADAAQMALDDLADAKMYTAEQETAKPIGFVRRYRLSDGRVATNPGSSVLPLVTGRCDESDDTVRVLRFCREGKKDITLVNFSTHPDVIGGTCYSADWPGFVRRFVEAEHPDTHCLQFTGTEGDSNHVDFLKPKEERFPHGSGYAHSRYMGRMIADAVNAVWDHMTAHADGALQTKQTSVFVRSNTVGEEKYDECKKIYTDYYAGKLDYKPTGEQLAFARRVIHIRENMSIYRELPIGVIGIADVRIVTFAGEPFTAYGESTRALTGGKFTLTLALTNGYQGYLPHARAFAQGGYEAANSHFTPTLQKQAMAAVEQALKEMEN
jgi:hypothetical protein